MKINYFWWEKSQKQPLETKKYKKCRFYIDFTKKQFALFYGFFFTWPWLVRPSWRSGVSGGHLDSGSWPKPAIDLDRLQIITVTTFEIAKTSGRPNICKIIWNEIILTQLLLLLFLWDDHTKKNISSQRNDTFCFSWNYGIWRFEKRYEGHAMLLLLIHIYMIA